MAYHSHHTSEIPLWFEVYLGTETKPLFRLEVLVLKNFAVRSDEGVIIVGGILIYCIEKVTLSL